MIDKKHEISNLDLPIAIPLRETLHLLSPDRQRSVMGDQSEDEFISSLVDVYLYELEMAMHAGYDEGGSKEIALNECLQILRAEDGEVFEA